MRFYGIDTETFPISGTHPYPQMVCAQISWQDSDRVRAWVASAKCDRDQLLSFLQGVLADPEAKFVLANAQFDMIVLSLWEPLLEPLIWEAYAQGRVVDILTMHKMLALAEWGDIDSTPFDDPNRQAEYSQASLTRWYLGKDRAQEKKSSVRTEYSFVDGVPVGEWEEEFVRYAMDDAADLIVILERLLNRSDKSLGRETLLRLAGKRAAKHLALGWMTYNGMRVDKERVLCVEDEVETELDLSNFPNLIEQEIIIPPQPPVPYANGAKAHVKGCKTPKTCECPPKLAAAKREVLKRKKLQDLMLSAARKAPNFKLALTDKGVSEHDAMFGERVKSLPAVDEKFDQHPEWVSTNKKVFTPLVPFDETVAEYARRAAVIKMRTDYVHRFFWDVGNGMPKAKAMVQASKSTEAQSDSFNAEAMDIQVTDRMRFNFKELVSTGRTGSFAGTLYPSMNGQNPDPRIRVALVADPGYILYSTDYGALELRCAAWRCLQEGIDSVLVKLFRDGKCPHQYLGAALLRDLGENVPMDLRGAQGMEAYAAFEALKKSDPKLFKMWRTLAKPTGLGNWGGMGPATALVTAHAPPYNLTHITLDQMTAAREVWRAEFPEWSEAFNVFKTKLVDEEFSHYDQEGERQTRYMVITPGGMVRRNCVYTVAANGLLLQPPSAEGVGHAVFDCVRASRDVSQDSAAYGAVFVDFLHDELLYQLPEHEDFDRTESMRHEIERLMCEGVNKVLTGIPMTVESAAMYRWDKFAPETFDEQGRLVPADKPIL